MNDPIRTLDDPSASPALKQLLGSARNDGPSAADLARLAAKLGPLLVATAPVGAAAATSTAAATKATAAVATGTGLLKVTVLAAVGGTVIAAGAFQAGRSYQGAHAPPPKVVEKVVTVAAPPLAPAAPEVVEPEPPAEEPIEPAAELPRKPLQHVAKKPEPAPAPKLTEVELLEQAMAAMKSGDAKGALALTARHAREFSTGALAQEREMLAIEALVRLGNKGAARARADTFRATYPTSSHLLRLDALVGR